MSSIENIGLALNPIFPSVPVLVHWNRHEMPTAYKHLVGPIHTHHVIQSNEPSRETLTV